MRTLMLFEINNVLHSFVVNEPSKQLLHRSIFAMSLDTNTVIKDHTAVIYTKAVDSDLLFKQLFSPSQD